MTKRLPDFEAERAGLLKELCELDDFRPGSITLMNRRCGKPTCHCSKADDPGHGPTKRLTYKMKGKSYCEALSSPDSIRRTEREIAGYRRFQDLVQKLVEVNWNICRQRAIDVDQEGKKNAGRQSGKKSVRK
jgi:hypothetical protein